MDAAWLGALASLISALIVCATAVAAFAQLRHYRNANDIVVYLRRSGDQDQRSVYLDHRALWASGTNGRGSSYGLIQNDGNFVVYTNNGAATWASRGGKIA